jgi:serine/threonine-protein kinase
VLLLLLLLLLLLQNYLYKITPSGTLSNQGSLLGSEGLIMLANDTLLVVRSGSNDICRYESPTSCVRVVGTTGVAGFSGDGGPAASAKLEYPMKGYGDPNNTNRFWFAEIWNHRIRKVRAVQYSLPELSGVDAWCQL